MQYLCTFGSGWDKAVKKIFDRKFSNYEIKHIGDGIIIFDSNAVINIKQLFFLNNVYLLLKSNECNSNDFDSNVNNIINGLKLDYDAIKKNLQGINSRNFKLIGINGNQPCKLNYKTLFKLENEIQNRLRIKPSKDRHDLDFVFLERTDGMMYFLLKLSYNRVNEKNLEQGSLRPEVSYLLSSLADIKETDIILDPFTGSGSIPKEIMKRFKYNMLFASELDEEKYNRLKKEYKGNDKKFYIKNFDALDMPFFKDNFIDAVITDPPWNVFEHIDKDYTDFYYKMLLELKRIVKKDGKIIILMGNESEFENALKKTNLELQDKLSVLINGKKAKVYTLRVN